MADSFYDQNDTISGFMNSTLLSGFVSNGPGYLQVPSINFDGTCNDNNYASFENKVTLTDQDSTCLRTLSTNAAEFEAQCTSQFSIQRYVTDLWIAKYLLCIFNILLLSFNLFSSQNRKYSSC